ncbi:MAG: TIGR02391 family protein [Haloechinothrix sp.]
MVIENYDPVRGRSRDQTGGALGFTFEELASLPVEHVAIAVLRTLGDSGSHPNWFKGDHGRAVAESNAALDAVLEGWQWLLAQGYVAWNPLGNYTDHAYPVTRRGRALRDDPERGLEDAAARARLGPGLDLHDRPGGARTQFLMGEYELAVLAAMREVEIRVRERAGLPQDEVGVAMVRKALAEGGPLDEGGMVTAEVQARQHLFAGAIGLFKNPSSHRPVDYDDPIEAAEAILFADLLLRLLDRTGIP